MISDNFGCYECYVDFNLCDVASDIMQFAVDRDWNQFHSTRNLVLALVGEVGELAELVQWRTDVGVESLVESEEGRKAFEDELSDIAIYLIRLSQQNDVDLAKAIKSKLADNATRYPIETSRGNAEKSKARRRA